MGLIEWIQGKVRSKELEAGLLTIKSKVRDTGGKMNGRVKCLLESRFIHRNLAYVIFTDTGIQKLEEGLGEKLEEDDKLKVVFKKLE